MVRGEPTKDAERKKQVSEARFGESSLETPELRLLYI